MTTENFSRVRPVTENEEIPPIIDTSTTSCYMYKVSMIVQVIAPNRDLADLKLDQEGGYVSNRNVEFVRSIVLYQKEEEESDE